MYTKTHYETFDEFGVPEVLRTSLEEALLQVKVLLPDQDAAGLLVRAIDPPSQAQLDEATRMLHEMGATNPDGTLTILGLLGGGDKYNCAHAVESPHAPHPSTHLSANFAQGDHLAALPVGPATGKMLIWASVLGVPSEAITIAAYLAGKDPFVNTQRDNFTDIRRAKEELVGLVRLIEVVCSLSVAH